jgi:hypothetical protein
VGKGVSGSAFGGTLVLVHWRGLVEDVCFPIGQNVPPVTAVHSLTPRGRPGP